MRPEFLSLETAHAIGKRRKGGDTRAMRRSIEDTRFCKPRARHSGQFSSLARSIGLSFHRNLSAAAPVGPHTRTDNPASPVLEGGFETKPLPLLHDELIHGTKNTALSDDVLITDTHTHTSTQHIQMMQLNNKLIL